MLGKANYSKLVIGDIDNPFAEIEPFEPETHQGTHKKIPLTSTQMGDLGAIFQHIPALASNLLTATSSTYIMRFSPEVAKGIADGTYSIMKATEGGVRAIAVDSQGRIVGQAALLSASSIQLAAAVTVVWQGLAIITAQHYLSEINSKLEDIKKELIAIKEHMEAKDYSVLQSSLKQIKEISLTLESSDLDKDERNASINELKRIERDCGEVYYTYHKLMEKEFQIFGKSDFSDFWQPKFGEAIQKGLSYVNYAEVTIKAIFVQILSVLLRCSIPGNKLAKIHALEVLNKELDTWLSLQNKFHSLFQDKIINDADSFVPVDMIQNFFGQGKPLAKARRHILDGAMEKKDEAMEMHYSLKLAVEDKLEFLSDNKPQALPMALSISVDSNYRVTQVREYKPSN